MRKFLAVAAVAALALAVAVPAMALDFKFGGEYRVRFYDGANLGFVDTAGFSNPRGVQVRVRPRFDVSDDNGNITATLRLEIGDIEFGNGGGAHGVTTAPGVGTIFVTPGSSRTGNGSGGSLGNDGVNVETKWAYIDAALPFGVPLRMRAGIQPWYLPKGMIVDDDVAGLRFYGTSGPVSYEAAWYRASGGPTATTTAVVCTNATCTTTATAVTSTQATTSNAYDNNLDFYQGRVDFAAAKALNAGIYGVYGRNAATGTFAANGNGGGAVKTWTFYGLTVAGDVDILKYDLDMILGRANGMASDGQDVSGYVIDGGVHIPIGPTVVNLGGSYATGDKANGGRHEAMPFISPGWNGPSNGTIAEMVGSGGVFDAVEYTQDFPGGLITMGASLEYRPVKALWLRAAYLYSRFTRSQANCGYQTANTCFGATYTRLGGSAAAPGPTKTSFGSEINLRADWDVWIGFKVMGELGWIIPGSGKTAGEYVLQLLYNF